MQRYFLPSTAWKGNKVIINNDDFHHMVKVMRFKVGDKIICNKEDGKAALCEINAIYEDFIEGNILEWLEENVELPIHVAIVQGIPKGDKFELVLQKGTELGASSFIPYQSERSISVWDDKKVAKKMKRYNKIVKEASEQCHRNKIPTVHAPINKSQLLKLIEEYDMCIFAYEEEAKTSSYQSFSRLLALLQPGQRLLIVIGPEGGISEKEAVLFKEAGFNPVRLGPRILRTETASLYALASISYHFEESEFSDSF